MPSPTSQPGTGLPSPRAARRALTIITSGTSGCRSPSSSTRSSWPRSGSPRRGKRIRRTSRQACSALLGGPDDLSKQRGELTLLLLGKARADHRLAGVESRKQPFDHGQSFRLKADKYQPAVAGVTTPLGEPALLQRLQHPGQRALGDPPIAGQMPSLLLAPHP